ncbi:MAG: hypothetical protein IPK72_13280 [Candidatus Eisenbacteria bacterium]|nr:hypothetical protein [Candidatus Eisenbacteria bacterium]
MAKLSWETVCRVDKTSIELALGGDRPSLDGLTWIGVDEVSRTGGHVYFTVVTDLKSGSVVWLGEGRRRRACAPSSRSWVRSDARGSKG